MNKYISLLIKLLLTVYVVGMASLTYADILPAPFKVIPQPRKVELLDGSGLEFGALKFIRKGGFSHPVLGPVLARLPKTENGGEGILTLTLSQDRSLPQSGEGYVLLIQKNEVKISSKGEGGLF